jgi:hypothetical protein
VKENSKLKAALEEILNKLDETRATESDLNQQI